MILNTAIEERVVHLHQAATVVLIHEDVMAIDVAECRSRGQSKVIRNRHLPKLRAGGVDVVFETVGGTSLHSTFPLLNISSSGSNALKRTLELIDYMNEDLADCQDEVILATSMADIERAVREKKIALFYSLEGADMLENSLGLIRTLYHLGVRSIEPAWLFRGPIADGSWERGNNGLSKFGVEAIGEMNRLGIVIDVSHTTDAGFWDILETSTAPVIASHSNARAVCNHQRNLTDEQIRALAKKGGVVGLTLNFISKEQTPGHWELGGTIDDLVDHVDHIANLVGPKYVGLGLDLNEGERFPADIYTEIWKGTIFAFEFVYPPGLDSVSFLQNLTLALVKRAYSDQDITDILGNNFLDVFRKVFSVVPTAPASATLAQPSTPSF
jgi:membrane dipeptidase